MIRARISMALVAAVLLVGAASPAAAQQHDPAATAISDAVEREIALPSAARLAPSPSSVALLSAPPGARVDFERSSSRTAVSAPQARDRSGIPFMVAGAALFVSGAIAGDTGGTLLMVGGAGIGAFGLFVYFGGDTD